MANLNFRGVGLIREGPWWPLLAPVTAIKHGTSRCMATEDHAHRVKYWRFRGDFNRQ